MIVPDNEPGLPYTDKSKLQTSQRHLGLKTERHRVSIYMGIVYRAFLIDAGFALIRFGYDASIMEAVI